MKLQMAFLVLAVLVFGSSRTLSAQEYDNRNLDGCVRTFYDPSAWNWFSFQNTCNEPIKIVFCKRGGGQQCEGQMTIKPGAKSSIGRTAESVNAWGGVSWYVCPAAYTPVVNGRYPEKGGARYRCRRS
jgi:hypothetical protein